jgi:hypothetical protein
VMAIPTPTIAQVITLVIKHARLERGALIDPLYRAIPYLCGTTQLFHVRELPVAWRKMKANDSFMCSLTSHSFVNNSRQRLPRSCMVSQQRTRRRLQLQDLQRSISERSEHGAYLLQAVHGR